jgi:hypothetical protein
LVSPASYYSASEPLNRLGSFANTAAAAWIRNNVIAKYVKIVQCKSKSKSKCKCKCKLGDSNIRIVGRFLYNEVIICIIVKSNIMLCKKINKVSIFDINIYLLLLISHFLYYYKVANSS